MPHHARERYLTARRGYGSDLTGRGTRGSSLPTVRTAILLNPPLALTRLTAIVVTVAILEPYTKGYYALALAADKLCDRRVRVLASNIVSDWNLPVSAGPRGDVI